MFFIRFETKIARFFLASKSATINIGRWGVNKFGLNRRVGPARKLILPLIFRAAGPPASLGNKKVQLFDERRATLQNAAVGVSVSHSLSSNTK